MKLNTRMERAKAGALSHLIALLPPSRLRRLPDVRAERRRFHFNVSTFRPTNEDNDDITRRRRRECLRSRRRFGIATRPAIVNRSRANSRKSESDSNESESIAADFRHRVILLCSFALLLIPL